MGEEESAVLLSGVRQPPLKVRHEISRPRNRLTTMEQAQIAAGKSPFFGDATSSDCCVFPRSGQQSENPRRPATGRVHSAS